MEGNTITMQEIFCFEQTGVDSNGRVEGSFHMQGVMPRFFEKFKAHGVTIPYDMFELGEGRPCQARERTMNLFIAAVVSIAALCIIEGVFLVLTGRSTPETRRIKKQLEELSSASVPRFPCSASRGP